MGFGLTGDEVIAIYVDVLTGGTPPADEPESHAAFRAKVTPEVEEARAQGLILDVPSG